MPMVALTYDRPMKLILTAMLVAVTTGLSAQDLPSADAVPLAGLWSVSLGTDISRQGSADILGLYPAGSVQLNDPQGFAGVNLGLRRHLMDQIYVGLGFSSMPRSYSFDVGNSAYSDTFDLDGLNPYLMAGFVWYRGSNLYLDLQVEAGLLFLNQAGFERSGSSTLKADIEGSTASTAASLGGVWFFIPSVGLELRGGYRRAYLEHLRLSSGPAAEFNLSASGPHARAGLIFFWGQRDPWGAMGSSVEAPASAPPEKN